MPIPTRETLKAFFLTGEHPDQAEFEALIDAAYDLAQSAQDKADAAMDLVEASLPMCLGALRVDQLQSSFTSAKFREQDCTFTITSLGNAVTFTPTSGSASGRARWQVDVVFNTAAANTAYTANFALFSKTTLGCSFYVDVAFMFMAGVGGGRQPVWDNVTFTIWP